MPAQSVSPAQSPKSGGWFDMVTQPVLLVEALRVAVAFRTARGILPGRDLLRWRVATAYGTPDHPVDPVDLAAFLQWRRDLRRSL